MANWTGITAGLRQADIDNQSRRMNNLAMQKEEISIAQSLMVLQQQAKMIQGMNSGEAPPKPGELADNLERMSSVASQAGMFDKAEGFAKAGSQIRKNQSDIEENRFNESVKSINLYSALLKDVTSEDGWKQANALFKLQTGKDSPLANQPFNPEMIGKLQVGLVSAKDQALINATKARERASNEQAKTQETRRELVKAQTRVANDRAAALEKAGATAFTPKAGQVKAITDLLVSDFGASLPPEEQRVLARPVAERMVELIKKEHLSESEAAARAYKEAKDRDDFGGIRARMPMSGTLKRPLTIPEDKTKLKPNMYYEGTGKYKGQTLLWSGTGFRLAKPAVSPPETDDEEDDTGEEE